MLISSLSLPSAKNPLPTGSSKQVNASQTVFPPPPSSQSTGSNKPFTATALTPFDPYSLSCPEKNFREFYLEKGKERFPIILCISCLIKQCLEFTSPGTAIFTQSSKEKADRVAQKLRLLIQDGFLNYSHTRMALYIEFVAFYKYTDLALVPFPYKNNKEFIDWGLRNMLSEPFFFFVDCFKRYPYYSSLIDQPLPYSKDFCVSNSRPHYPWPSINLLASAIWNQNAEAVKALTSYQRANPFYLLDNEPNSSTKTPVFILALQSGWFKTFMTCVRSTEFSLVKCLAYLKNHPFYYETAVKALRELVQEKFFQQLDLWQCNAFNLAHEWETLNQQYHLTINPLVIQFPISDTQLVCKGVLKVEERIVWPIPYSESTETSYRKATYLATLMQNIRCQETFNLIHQAVTLFDNRPEYLSLIRQRKWEELKQKQEGAFLCYAIQKVEKILNEGNPQTSFHPFCVSLYKQQGTLYILRGNVHKKDSNHTIFNLRLLQTINPYTNSPHYELIIRKQKPQSSA